MNIIDDFNREGLRIEVAKSFLSARLIRVLDMPALWFGYSKQLRLDNGPEFISKTFAEWAEARLRPRRIVLPEYEVLDLYQEKNMI